MSSLYLRNQRFGNTLLRTPDGKLTDSATCCCPSVSDFASCFDCLNAVRGLVVTLTGFVDLICKRCGDVGFGCQIDHFFSAINGSYTCTEPEEFAVPCPGFVKVKGFAYNLPYPILIATHRECADGVPTGFAVNNYLTSVRAALVCVDDDGNCVTSGPFTKLRGFVEIGTMNDSAYVCCQDLTPCVPMDPTFIANDHSTETKFWQDVCHSSEQLCGDVTEKDCCGFRDPVLCELYGSYKVYTVHYCVEPWIT